MNLLHIANDPKCKKKIESTNYFNLKYARPPHNFVYLSFNAGACRVLVPDSSDFELDAAKQAKQTEIILEKFGMNDLCYSIIFDDNSDYPYVLTTTAQASDRILTAKDHMQEIDILIYKRSLKMGDRPKLVIESKGIFKYHL